MSETIEDNKDKDTLIEEAIWLKEELKILNEEAEKIREVEEGLDEEVGELKEDLERLNEEFEKIQEERGRLDEEENKLSEEWVKQNKELVCREEEYDKRSVEWEKRKEEYNKRNGEWRECAKEYNKRKGEWRERSEEYDKRVKANSAKKEYETILKKRAINKLFNTFLVLSGSLWGSVLLFSAYKSGVGVWFFVGLFVCYLLGKAFLEINVKEDDSYNAFRLRMITFLNGWVAGHVAVYALLAFGRGSLNNDALVIFGLYSLIFLANFWFSSQYKKILKIKPWSKEFRN